MHMIIKAAGIAGFISVLAGCGGGPALTENERKYADACTSTLEKFGQKGKGSVCECAARIMVPKLTQAEVNAFNAPPELMGKILTVENTAPHGFTPTDFGSMMQKTSSMKAEAEKTCGT